MPTEKELAMQRKQDELQQQQQAEANAVLATQPASLGRELTPKEQSMVNMTQALNPETKVEAPAVTDTPLVTEKPKYTPLYDWSSGLSMKDAYKQGKHDRDAIWMDREKWGRENDNPANFFEAMEMTPDDFDPKKTYTENVDDQKKAKARERMEMFGNFLRHLGNFIGTTAFGAPSQTLEPAKELTARQQAMRDRTEALRTAYNNNFFEAYNRQRAMDRQAELDKQNADYRNEQLKISNEGLKLRQQAEDRRTTEMWLNNDIKNRRLTLDKAKLKLKEAIDRGRLTVAQGNLALEELKAGGYTVETTEEDGKKIQKKTPNINGKRSLPNRRGLKQLPKA
jgi:hypothetical protein